MGRSVLKVGLLSAAVVGVTLLTWPVAKAFSAVKTTSALRVQTAGQPQRVHGTDGREHIEYDLVLTNWFTAGVTLRSLEVRGDGGRLLRLSGAQLGAATLRIGTFSSTRRKVAPAVTVVTPVDLALPRSAGRTAPGRLTNRIRYAIPGNPPLAGVIGSTTVEVPPSRVDRRAPVVIASPVRGSGWLDGNGCCDDPTSPHRHTTFATSTGGYETPELFAIDWARVVNGVVWTGDGTKNSDYPIFGAPLYAVVKGTVVRAVDDKPDIPPRTQNPFLRTPHDFGGNQVILKIGPGRYACYAHLKAGSVRVRTGQQVRVGQRIGRIGNSGNTTGPHLHFGIQRRPDCLSKNEPFEIDRFNLQGMADPNSPVPHIKIKRTPRVERRSLPMILSVATFMPPDRPRGPSFVRRATGLQRAVIGLVSHSASTALGLLSPATLA
jgi:hypothetical protein